MSTIEKHEEAVDLYTVVSATSPCDILAVNKSK